MLDADQILQLLADGKEGLRQRLLGQASDEGLREALERAVEPRALGELCEVVGERRVPGAAPLLFKCLVHADAELRHSAADALGNLRDPAAGELLLRRFGEESDPGVRVVLASALGAVGHRAAIPSLMAALDAGGALAYNAIWSLGELEAAEAVPRLKQLRQSSDADLVRGSIQALRRLGQGIAVISRTVWRSGNERLDVENPQPDQRRGTIHYLPRRGEKYLYDAKRGQWLDPVHREAAPAGAVERLPVEALRRALDLLGLP